MAAEIPPEIILDILSRMPLKSLARMRCVSKPWCKYIDDDDQYFKIYRGQRSPDEPFRMVTALRNKHRQPFIGVHAIESKIVPLLKPETIIPLESKREHWSGYHIYTFLGSCNGLVYLTRNSGGYPSCFIVVSPLREEFYWLPPTKYQFMGMNYAAHGLGFDDSTNTFKMVLLESTHTKPENQCALLHVFGTNSWRQIISKVPLNPIGGSLSRSIFSGGCLHWLAEESKMLTLDMRTEVFRLINLPKKYGELVDLNGEVGWVGSSSNERLEVWVLKQKEWAIHCRFDRKPPLPTYGSIAVLGCWNKKGDLLIKSRLSWARTRWFVYYLKGGFSKEVMLTGDHDDYSCKLNDDIIIYPCSLFSVHGNKFMSGTAVIRSQPAKPDMFNRAIRAVNYSALLSHLIIPFMLIGIIFELFNFVKLLIKLMHTE